MKSCSQLLVFELGQFGGLLKEFIPPGCQSSACSCSAGEARWAGGRGGTPLLKPLLRFRVGQPRAIGGKEAAPCGKSCQVQRHRSCGAGRVHPPDSLGAAPRGWGERVKAGAAEQPRAGVYPVQVCTGGSRRVCARSNHDQTSPK